MTMGQGAAQERVTILLCTYQGGRWLEAQLNSYLAQSHEAWDLWVSDDGSTDETRALIAAFADRVQARHTVRLLEGPRQGSGANFLSLLSRGDLPEGMLAVSDQDDVWLPHKLARGVEHLRGIKGPALYGAASLHVDQDLKVTGHSIRQKRPPSFRNALLQNVVSGHSTMLNPEAAALLRRFGPPKGVLWHDWWLYQLITGLGGTVVIDPEPVLMYRQHGGNVMGGYSGFGARLHRLRQILLGEFGGWFEDNLRALSAIAPHLAPENREMVKALLAAPKGRERARLMRSLGLHRQGQAETKIMLTAARLGRI